MIRGGSRCGFGNIFNMKGDQSAGTDSHGRARTQEARDGLLDYWIGGAEGRLHTRAARLENVSLFAQETQLNLVTLGVLILIFHIRRFWHEGLDKWCPTRKENCSKLQGHIPGFS
jgi:hypothetical protein